MDEKPHDSMSGSEQTDGCPLVALSDAVSQNDLIDCEQIDDYSTTWEIRVLAIVGKSF